MIHVQPKDYEIIAAFGIIIDFVALIVIFAASPDFPGPDFVLLGLCILCLPVFLGFTGLLHGAARILKIENRRLLFSEFIAFTSILIFFVVLGLASAIFASVIMWITAAGMAKFMYRTEWSKALLVSLPLLLLAVVIFVLVLGW